MKTPVRSIDFNYSLIVIDVEDHSVEVVVSWDFQYKGIPASQWRKGNVLVCAGEVEIKRSPR